MHVLARIFSSYYYFKSSAKAASLNVLRLLVVIAMRELLQRDKRDDDCRPNNKHKNK